MAHNLVDLGVHPVRKFDGHAIHQYRAEMDGADNSILTIATGSVGKYLQIVGWSFSTSASGKAIWYRSDDTPTDEEIIEWNLGVNHGDTSDTGYKPIYTNVAKNILGLASNVSFDILLDVIEMQDGDIRS